MGETSLFELDQTVEESAVIAQLGAGREKAVKAEAVAKKTGIPERRVREIVKHLVERHACAIGSAVVPPAGFYFIIREAELRAVRKNLVGRAMSILRRARAYDRSGAVAKILGQMELFDE